MTVKPIIGYAKDLVSVLDRRSRFARRVVLLLFGIADLLDLVKQLFLARSVFRREWNHLPRLNQQPAADGRKIFHARATADFIRLRRHDGERNARLPQKHAHFLILGARLMADIHQMKDVERSSVVAK